MSTHKHIDRICLVVTVFSLLLSLLFMNGEALGIQNADRLLGYESRLFDTTKVHTIDIVMDDWDGFLATCENEEYALCSVVIDGEAFPNVGIRAKGNTSLSTVSSMDSDRYSFKIEFDQYDSTTSYHGLDKLSLNNIIQDATFMKDYLTYRMMDEFGADAPLCSYAYLTINGADWGLYLAVESIEDSFLQRNYGSNHGELYKPDSMSFGGGRGNGKDFSMEEFDFDSTDTVQPQPGENRGNASDDRWNRGDGNRQMPEDFDPSALFGGGETTRAPENFDPSAAPGTEGAVELPTGEAVRIPEGVAPSSKSGGGRGGGMGSSDVKLQYIDDDPSGYSNIFSNAKTDISEADQIRLIEALKRLSSRENIKDVVDVDEVLRYFVVHNFVVNGDSYTGSMIHNYYLYEKNGQLSMIPWDYNLAFGTFQGSSAQSAVNDPIDTPLSVTGSGDRPMADWIFSGEEYTALYHQYFEEFLNSVDFLQMIDETRELIAPYVEQDPTKFYSYEEFETGAETLREFCTLRAESVRGQLCGTIPSTSAGQSQDSTALVDASHITLSAMGSMNMGGGMGGRGDMPFGQKGQTEFAGGIFAPDAAGFPETMAFPEGMAPSEGAQNSGTMQPTQIPGKGASAPGG